MFGQLGIGVKNQRFIDNFKGVAVFARQPREKFDIALLILRHPLNIDGGQNFANLDVIADLDSLGSKVSFCSHFVQHFEVFLATNRRIALHQIREHFESRLQCFVGLTHYNLSRRNLFTQAAGCCH